MWPHRRQPTRLPYLWDFPGNNTGVGWHFLLQYMKVKSESEVGQSCLTLRDPMDCSLPGSSIHGIFQARALEWGAIAFSVALCETVLNPELPKSWDKATYHLSCRGRLIFCVIMLVKWCLKFSKSGFSNMWTMNFQMFKLVLEKAEEPEIKTKIIMMLWSLT